MMTNNNKITEVLLTDKFDDSLFYTAEILEISPRKKINV